MSARSDTGGTPPPPHFTISAIFFNGYVPILETFNRDPILASHMTTQSVGIHQCISNSAKLRILMVLKDNGPMTAKQMISAGVGIPQTTLYRLLRNMEENGILTVVSENKVRAMTERTYDVSDSLKDFDAEMIGRNDLEGYCRMFEGFTFNLLKEFESYARREDADIARDGSMFVALPIFATAEELERMAAGIRDVIRPHLSRTSDEQRMHTFAAVVTPPTQEGEDAL